MKSEIRGTQTLAAARTDDFALDPAGAEVFRQRTGDALLKNATPSPRIDGGRRTVSRVKCDDVRLRPVSWTRSNSRHVGPQPGNGFNDPARSVQPEGVRRDFNFAGIHREE